MRSIRFFAQSDAVSSCSGGVALRKFPAQPDALSSCLLRPPLLPTFSSLRSAWAGRRCGSCGRCVLSFPCARCSNVALRTLRAHPTQCQVGLRCPAPVPFAPCLLALCRLGRAPLRLMAPALGPGALRQRPELVPRLLAPRLGPTTPWFGCLRAIFKVAALGPMRLLPLRCLLGTLPRWPIL
jgi:hypothetical protein